MSYSSNDSTWTRGSGYDAFYIYGEEQQQIANGETRTWDEMASIITNTARVSSSITNQAKP